MRAPVRDRIFAGIGTVLVVGMLGAALVLGLSVDLRRVGANALAVIDVRLPPPPPPPPAEHVVSKRAKDKPSPRNLRNTATPVVAPPPIVIPPKPPPIVSAPKPDVGAAAQTGASDRPGSGQGAGGRGDGAGGGGEGDGDGDVEPEQIGGRLKSSDLPLELASSGAEYHVGVRYYVDERGEVSRCAVTRSSGHADFDRRVCQLIEQRFRYRPAHDIDGPHGGYVSETHEFGVDRSEYPSNGR